MTYVRAIVPIILLLALSLGAAWVYRLGGADTRAELAEYKAKAAQQVAAAQAHAREVEARKARELAAIAEAYEKDKRDAEASQRKLVSDLRAGTVRLQKRWAGCVSEAGRTAAELDAAARDREESAARVVRAARDADDQIRRLQEVVRKDRER